MSILKFKPIYQERVWGGRKLEETFGRTLPAGKAIGESWELVDRPEAQSVTANGPFAGKTLNELAQSHGDELFGPANDPGKPFPILVKWLDCTERLSLQVHPPTEIASILSGEPKTENWYIAESTDSAGLLVGLRRGVTRLDFERALAEKNLDQLVHRTDSHPGDSLLVQSGRIHAIDAGNLILEIQQNSDTTYRVYDWGRVGLDGLPRELHVEQSLRCIDFQDFEPEPLKDNMSFGEHILADCDEFRIRRVRLTAGERMTFPSGQEPCLIHVVSGQAKVDEETLIAGETALAPFSADIELKTMETTVLVVTDRFFRPNDNPPPSIP